jgi:hypothetical protein
MKTRNKGLLSSVNTVSLCFAAARPWVPEQPESLDRKNSTLIISAAKSFGHKRMQKMPCLNFTLEHADFKSPIYYSHCS